MDLKLDLKEFIEKYKAPETTSYTRDIIPYADGELLLEFYSYLLYVYDEEADKTIIVGHPDYMEAGLEIYLDFLLDMQRAINEKGRSLCRYRLPRTWCSTRNAT